MGWYSEQPLRDYRALVGEMTIEALRDAVAEQAEARRKERRRRTDLAEIAKRTDLGKSPDPTAPKPDGATDKV